MSTIFAVLMRDKEGFKRILISDRVLIINDEKHDLSELERIEAVNTHRVRIKKDKVEEIVPLGVLTIKIRNGNSFSIEVLNPLDTVEKLVVWLNSIYRHKKEKIFNIVESTPDKAVYEKE